METRFRLGTFFHLVGLTLMLIFVGSILSKATNVTYFFLSFAALSIGFILRRNKPAKESERFSWVRKAGQRSHEHREAKLNKKTRGKPVKSGGLFGKSRQGGERAGQGSEEESEENQQE